MIKNTLCLLILYLFISIPAYASETPENNPLIPYKKHKIILLSDNDAYIDPYSDKYYSAGHQIIYNSKEFDFSGTDITSKLSFLKNISLYPKNNVTSYFFGINQEIYTPDDKSENVSPQDYPYAGSLYLSFGVNQRRDKSYERLWLDIGVVGKYSFAQDMQNFIHSTVNPEYNSPLNWINQVGDEFIINLRYSWTSKFKLLDTKAIGIHLLPAASISLGNANTFLDLNSRLKIGHNIDTSFGHVKMNFGPASSGTVSNDFSIYVYGGIGSRFTARNIYIQGNSWDTPYRHEINTFFPYFEGGLAISYYGFEISYTITYKLKEYRYQPDNHTYGSIMIGLAI